MHISKDEIPAKIDVPGAKARVTEAFGDSTGFGTMQGEYFSLGEGTDIAPLLVGLEGDACQAPHWGYMISGEVVVSFTDGTEEACNGEDLFYWKPGHSVRVVRDAEIILFSPRDEHLLTVNHMLEKMKG
jgi:hypothetical protein